MRNILGDSRKVGLITIVSLVLLVAVLTLFGKGLAREEKKNGGGVIIHYRENDVIFIDEPLPTQIPLSEMPIQPHDTEPLEKECGDGSETRIVRTERSFASPDEVYFLVRQDNGYVILYKNEEPVITSDGKPAPLPKVYECQAWIAEWPDLENDDLVVITIDDNDPIEINLATIGDTVSGTD